MLETKFDRGLLLRMLSSSVNDTISKITNNNDTNNNALMNVKKVITLNITNTLKVIKSPISDKRHGILSFINICLNGFTGIVFITLIVYFSN